MEDTYAYLSGDAARAYVQQRAEELRLLREADRAVILPPVVAVAQVDVAPRSKPQYFNDVKHWFCPSCAKWVPWFKMGVRRKRWNGLDVYCKKCKVRKTRSQRGKER